MIKKVVFLVFVLFPSLIIAQTATVNGTSYGTIADAYDAAVGGDTIFIDGIFDEKLTSNKAVSLQGDDPDTDGIVFTGTGRVLFYTNEVLGDFNISNLTISGGNSTANGAGILIDKSKGNQITLNNLIIENNTTTAVGGGISINSANVDINSCIIKNNTALQGGGLHLGTNNNANDPDLDKIVNVKQSLITGNSSTTNGAGFYIYGFGNEMRITANFENTTIALNTAAASGGSGRIYGEAYAGDTSTNNVIVNMTHVTSARNSAALSTESEKNNFGIYFTTGGGGGPVFNAYNSILASAGIIGNRGINFIQSNPGSLINNVMGGQLNINTADVNTNNLTGRTAGQIGLAADLTDEGGFSNVLELTDGDAVDYCTSDTGTSLPVVDQRNYLRDDFPDAGAFELEGTLLPGASCATAIVAVPGVYNNVAISEGNGSASQADADDALWYIYTAEADGTININSCISNPSGINTRLWVYTNGCTSLTSVAEDDDGCSAPNSFGSIVTDMPVVGGQEYLIEWDDKWDIDQFDWELTFTAASGASCATAIVAVPGVYNNVAISEGNGSASQADADDALWYIYTAEADGTININSCISNPSGINTRLWVYTNGCTSLTSVAEDDDGCSAPNSFGSIVTDMPVVGGQEYLIEWDDKWDIDQFDWELTFTAASGASCATAIVAVPGVYNNVAISEGNGSASQADADDALWYIYTAEADGTININSCISNPSGINTRLWVYTNGCTSLTSVAEDDDGCSAPNSFGSIVTDMPVVGGQEYLIEWDDKWDIDQFDWELTFTAPIVELPITFEDSQTPIFVDFNGSETQIIVNPDVSGDNTTNTVAKNTVPANAGFAGVNFAVENLDITTLKGFTMTVWSPIADTPVLLKLENASTGVNSERAAITTTTGAWETISFDFSEEGDLTFESVTVFMNFNVVGDTDQTYYWDNLVQGEPLDVTQNDLVDIAIYPNPATSFITFDASEEIATLQIMNLLGQNVSIIEVNNTKSTINISQFRNGVYFIKVLFSSGNFKILKFIKK